MNPEPHKEKLHKDKEHKDKERKEKGDKGDKEELREKVVVMPFRQCHSSYHSKYEVYVKKDGKPVEVKDKSEKFVYY